MEKVQEQEEGTKEKINTGVVCFLSVAERKEQADSRRLLAANTLHVLLFLLKRL